MQLMLIFEILLLVAIVAGVFVCWDRRADGKRQAGEDLENRRQTPI